MVPAGRDSRRAVSDDQGFYMIQGLQEGEHELRTIATGPYPSVGLVVPAGLESVDLILEEGKILVVRGIVTDRDGRLLEGVLVTQIERPGREARTGGDGSYFLEFFLGRRQFYHLAFRKDGFRESRIAIRRDEVKDAAEWELNAKIETPGTPAAVTGIVRTGTGLFVEGERVNLQSPSSRIALTSVSDAAGRFLFSEVPPGEDYRIHVHPLGNYKDFLSSPFTVAEGGLELEIVLEPLGAGVIQGRMVDAGGNPVPRITLWLTNAEAAAKSREISGDDEGRFIVEDVPAGELIFRTRSEPRFAVRGIELAAATAASAVIVLDVGPHEVAGSVVDGTGTPLAGIRAELSWQRKEGRLLSSSLRRTRTDEAGRFRFSGVGEGPHRLSLSGQGYRSVHRGCDVGREGPLPPIEMTPPDPPPMRPSPAGR